MWDWLVLVFYNFFWESTMKAAIIIFVKFLCFKKQAVANKKLNIELNFINKSQYWKALNLIPSRKAFKV